MIYELFAEAAERKRCGIQLSVDRGQRVSCQGSEWHSLLIALMMRREGEMICKHLRCCQWLAIRSLGVRGLLPLRQTVTRMGVPATFGAFRD